MKTPILCPVCGHITNTGSLNVYITCSGCQKKIKRAENVVRDGGKVKN